MLRSPIRVWSLLVILTLLSYLSWAESSVADGRVAGTAVLALAFVKARLIGLHYMELDEAVLPLRLFFEAWIIVVCLALIAMFWAGG